MGVVAAALSPEVAQRIAASADRRYDDRFVVGSTASRIYCRPSCAATSARRANTRFFSSSAEARAAGLRPCKRCAPADDVGGSLGRRHAEVALQSLRLIEDGLVDREGVSGLARRLGYSERQLHRILVAELGAGATTFARAQRTHSARTLIDSSELTLAEVARAAGFGSIRQFNETMREVYAMSPTQLRSHARRAGRLPAGPLTLELACRQPFDGVALVRFLQRHEVPGLERIHGNSYTRSLTLERGDGIVTLTPTPSSVVCQIELEDLRDLAVAVARCRRLFDLDANPETIRDQLADRPVIGELARAHPGVRIPGTVDVFELAVRTIIRENAPADEAQAQTATLVRQHGRPLHLASEHVSHCFPSPAVLAAADSSGFPVDKTRACAIHLVANRVAAGELRLDAGAGLDEAAALLTLPGIGPWITSYIAMRALGDPDSFLYGCARVERALARLAIDASTAAVAALADQWRPWRSYAIAQLWRSLDDEDESL